MNYLTKDYSISQVELERGITINSNSDVEFIGRVCFRRSKISLTVDFIIGLENNLFMDDFDYLESNLVSNSDCSRYVLDKYLNLDF